MAKLKNIHPGEILSKEFLIPFNITAYKLAKDLKYLRQEYLKSSTEIEE